MTTTTIRVYRDLMEVAGRWAGKTKRLATRHHLLVLNLIGSPGAGKTRLLEATAAQLAGRFRFAVLEGDVETTRDAERLHTLGIPVSQIITSGDCHLSPQLVHTAFADLPLDRVDVVFVENVGNLVCPAEFDIGEAAKVAVLSVTEGEDKPIKYPSLFRQAGAIVLTKTDLLPHLTFDLDACLGYIRQVNPTAPILQLSAATGHGVDDWVSWVAGQRPAR